MCTEQPAPPDPADAPPAHEGLRPDAEGKVLAFLIEHAFWGSRWAVEHGEDGTPRIAMGSADVVIKGDDWVRALHHLARLALHAAASELTDALADLATYRQVYGPPPPTRRSLLPSPADQAGMQRVLDVAAEKLRSNAPWRPSGGLLHELITVLNKITNHGGNPDAVWWAREAILTVARGWFDADVANDAVHALLSEEPWRRGNMADLYGDVEFIERERRENRERLYEGQFRAPDPDELVSRPVPEQDRERERWPSLYPDGPHPDVPPIAPPC